MMPLPSPEGVICKCTHVVRSNCGPGNGGRADGGVEDGMWIVWRHRRLGWVAGAVSHGVRIAPHGVRAAGWQAARRGVAGRGGVIYHFFPNRAQFHRGRIPFLPTNARARARSGRANAAGWCGNSLVYMEKRPRPRPVRVRFFEYYRATRVRSAYCTACAWRRTVRVGPHLSRQRVGSPTLPPVSPRSPTMPSTPPQLPAGHQKHCCFLIANKICKPPPMLGGTGGRKGKQIHRFARSTGGRAGGGRTAELGRVGGCWPFNTPPPPEAHPHWNPPP
eukprot:gene24195-biopygen16399